MVARVVTRFESVELPLLLAALAGTKWWVHVQVSCSRETCCRGSLLVASLAVYPLPILRRFSESTLAPIACTDTSYTAKDMTIVAPTGVFSSIPRSPAWSKGLKYAAPRAFRVFTDDQEVGGLQPP
jgi:hypothetical protein